MTQATTDLTDTFRIVSRDAFWLTGMAGSGPHAFGRRWVRTPWAAFLAQQDGLPDGLDRSVFVSPCHGRGTEFSCYLRYASPEEPITVPAGFLSVFIPAHEYGAATVSGSQDDGMDACGALPAWIIAQGRQVDRELLRLEHDVAPPRCIGEPIDLEIWLMLA